MLETTQNVTCAGLELRGTEGTSQVPTTYVYAFGEGGKELNDLLGGKGANLAEMTKLRLPVPPGFTITTQACNAYLEYGAEPPGLHRQLQEHLEAIETQTGKILGDEADPLLLAVRSGARYSMPGMMDTILNIGLNDRSVRGLAAWSGDERFAWDAYRRLIQMFGKTVLGLPGEVFESALSKTRERHGASWDHELDTAAMRALAEEFKHIVATHATVPFPQDPKEQLSMAVRAVFSSWNGERARVYRKRENIAEDLGTAVNIMAMVFGNLGEDSGTGVAFTRDPASGQPGAYGDYLANAQGEDVVAGIRNPVPLSDLEKINKPAFDELSRIMSLLERHYRDLCDVEFTIERGKLWMLQTRVGKRTAAAAFRIASDLVDEGTIDLDDALARVTGHQLAQLMFPRFANDGEAVPIAQGVAASPGAAVGQVVFDSASAVEWARSGRHVILVRPETNPDDLPGMIAAAGIVTSRGGKTSHAAVVARGMGKISVCGADELDVDLAHRQVHTASGDVLTEGDLISVDGSAGMVYSGALPVVPSPVFEYFEHDSDELATDQVVASIDRLLQHADGKRQLDVRANADLPEDVTRARRVGAEGVGLCRTEHMFLGPRRELIEQVILAASADERHEPLNRLLELQRADFIEILAAMDGLPVTIRLLDPPLHEFLPDRTELAVRVATTTAHGVADEPGERLLDAVRRLHEHNPMLGLRGVRLGLVVPELYAMQVRAVAEATVHRLLAGGHPWPQIMVPLVADPREFAIVRELAERVIAGVADTAEVVLVLPIGTMIELPRAAVMAEQIADVADFCSFGTNDLTQTTWGLSRDDAEASFLSNYLDHGVFSVSPFQTLDVEGVGRLVETAVQEGRASRPELEIGVCGEHGGDPDSVHFFHAVGLDYVSCSPFQVPIARLEAGRAALDLGSGRLGSDAR